MTKLEEAREQFKESYKKIVIDQIGIWTNYDEDILNEKCKKIEKQSAIIATVGIVVVYSLIIYLVYFLLKLVGII